MHTATSGAVLSVAAVAKGDVLVGGYAQGSELKFDFLDAMNAPNRTAFLGLLSMRAFNDDDGVGTFARACGTERPWPRQQGIESRPSPDA